MAGETLVGTGERCSDAELAAIARQNGLKPSRLFALRAVEAPRGPFDGKNRLTILWEGHIWWRYIPQKLRAKAQAKGLAWPRWGDVSYGNYEKQYSRFDAAMKIDSSAMMAASYGSFQPMGFNHKACGFTSAGQMIEAFKTGEVEHVKAALAFIRSIPKMWDALVRGLWKVFARFYNGAGYAKNRYDVKLAAADRLAEHHNSGAALVATREPPPAPSPVVMAAQKQLLALGYDLGKKGADGWYGNRTRKAVTAFQKAHPDLHANGTLGEQTLAALDMAAQQKKAAAANGTGAVVIATGGTAAAAGVKAAGWSLWAVGGIAAAGLVVAGLIYWRYRNRFAWEREYLRNARNGIVVAVKPWAERAHELTERL